MTVIPDTRRRPGVVVVLAFLVTLAGRFTLDRLGFDLPLLLNDVRVPLFAILLMSFALELNQSGHRPAGTGTGTLLAILLLIGYQIVSATWAPGNAVVGPAMIDLTCVAILVFIYVMLAEWDRDRVVELTLGCFQVTAWLYFLVAAAGFGRGANGRWAVPGGGPNVFVRIMVIGAFTSVYFYFRGRRRPIWLLGLPAFLTGALASGSRGGLVALIITLVLALPSALQKLGKRGGSLTKPVLATIALAGVTWAIAGRAIGAFVQQRFVTETFQQGYTSGRSELFKYALHLFLERPFLGTGVNGFSVVSSLGEYDRYVHNLPLAVASEGGIVGLFLLINAWVTLRHEFAKVPRAERSLEARAAGYCGVFVGGASLFSGDYYDARLMWILLVLATVRPAGRDGPQP
ncbi:O-antigen ligase family protein [Actinoplanes sp. NPDC051411]|uniref:O-antigen ligase family protein n=1 Tax=Actinoplanes sp. NPDC051411 TaxID=3155522 RepID=UPI00344852DD